jgi:hypothetical protein
VRRVRGRARHIDGRGRALRADACRCRATAQHADGGHELHRPSLPHRPVRDRRGAPGDTIRICAGTYVEGSGDRGSNALTIDKNVNLVGDGGDVVTVEPRNHGGQIAESAPDVHHGRGDLVAVTGATVHISGITFDANGVYASAGVVFTDAAGSITRSRVTGLDLDESASGYTRPGGFRGNPFGYGIALVSATATARTSSPSTTPGSSATTPAAVTRSALPG